MSNDRPSIVEKVKFWEEQDKINQAFIPRVIEMHESLHKLSKQSLRHSDQNANLIVRLDAIELILNELKVQYNKSLEDLTKQTSDHGTQVADFVTRLNEISLVVKETKNEVNGLSNRQDISEKKNNQSIFAIIVASLAVLISIISFFV